MRRSIASVVALCGLAGCAGLPVDRNGDIETTGGIESAGTHYQQRLNKDGTMPVNGLWTAKLQRDRMLLAHPPGGPQDTIWTWIGPGNIGGRLRSILVSPADPSTIYVGAAGGGVWKTTNGGTSWFALPDFVPSLPIGCMAFDPFNPGTLFVGTGEGVFDTVEGTSNSAAMRGAGIFKSTDAGASWAQIPATANANWYFVNRLSFQPGGNQVVLAATNSGIWRSTDGGNTWTQQTATRTLDIQYDPTNGAKAVAGRGDGVSQYSLDGGLTWTNAAGFPASGTSRIELTYAPSNTSIVYAGVAFESASDSLKVYRSTDGGQTFAAMTTGSVTTLGSYTGVIWVDPLNPATILVGTQNMYRSTNSGTTLSSTFGGVHSDHHYIAQDPGYNGTTNKTLYFACDGGIYKTTDSGGSTVTNLNHNLGVTQFYGAAINNASGVVVAGAQDNGTNRYTGNAQGWTLNVIGGDGGYCASDPTDPNYFYAEYQRLTIHRSTNGGATFSPIFSGITENSTLSTNFIPYFLIDPNNPSRLLGCGRSLWRTNNAKTGSPPTWTVIKQPLQFAPPPNEKPAQDHFLPNDPRNIATCAVAEGNSDIIWVGHNDGELYMTTNGTAAAPNWTRVDTNAPSWPGRWISRIVIDRSNPSRVYVSMLGYATDNIWRTIDAGQTWQNISGTGAGALPAIPVGALAQHRLAPSRLYAGTDIGMFLSTDDGNSWAPTATELGPVEIQELDWRNDTTLMAVTFGRGVYLGDASLPTCYANCDGSTNTPVLNVNDFLCFQNKFAAGDPAANCDGSTATPILNVNDFQCFLNAYAAGCP